MTDKIPQWRTGTRIYIYIYIYIYVKMEMKMYFPFLSLLPLESFVYSWQNGGEYTRVFLHFYKSHVHILRGRNSISCTFVEGESHRGEAYTKGDKTFFMRKLCFICFTLCLASRCLWCFELCLVLMLIMLLCWTCIHPYAIALYWLHVWMIIFFFIWSL